MGRKTSNGTGKSRAKNTNTTATTKDTALPEQTNKKISEKFLIALPLIEAIVIVIGFLVALPYQIKMLEKEMSAQMQIVDNNITNMNTTLNTQISNLAKDIEINSKNISASNTRIDNYIFENKSDKGIRVSFNPEINAEFFDGGYQVSDLAFIKSPMWSATDIIATDDDGNEYKAEELVDEKILVSYSNKNQETCFYGQYNDKNQWDGNCIINVYEKNVLKIIMDATYKDGSLISYEQILADDVQKRWIVSKRIANGDINAGETWTYIKEGDVEKIFNIDLVVSADMLSADYFAAHLKTPLLSYYNGNTSDGRYNDTTGEAYLISYFETGEIKTIYMGNMVDGAFNDDTGNAWYISKGLDTDYMYFKGAFMDGNTQNSESSTFINPISRQAIYDILDRTDINMDMVVFPEDV